MHLLRIVAITLPQLLILLPVAAAMNLLGGWEQSDAGFNTLLLLFMMAPVVTLSLLVTEFVRYRKLCQHLPEKTSRFWLRLSMALCIETLAINLAILSQLEM